MTDWFSAERKMTAEVEDEFGSNDCVLTPMAKPPNGRSYQDNTRAVFSCRGVFDWEYEKAAVKREESTFSTRGPALFVRRCELRYMPRKYDILDIPDPATCEVNRFEILDVRRDGLSGVIFELSQLGVQS